MSDADKISIKSASPTFYLWCVPGIVANARSLGYAIAVHGSLARDLDLIAIPWTDEACSDEHLVEALCAGLGCPRPSLPTTKPHGRRAWIIPLGGGPHIDLSVMPRQT